MQGISAPQRDGNKPFTSGHFRLKELLERQYNVSVPLIKTLIVGLLPLCNKGWGGHSMSRCSIESWRKAFISCWSAHNTKERNHRAFAPFLLFWDCKLESQNIPWQQSWIMLRLFFSVYYFCWCNFGVGHSWKRNSCHSPFSLFSPALFSSAFLLVCS